MTRDTRSSHDPDLCRILKKKSIFFLDTFFVFIKSMLLEDYWYLILTCRTMELRIEELSKSSLS